MYRSVGPEHLRDFERRRSLRFVLPSEEDITLTIDGRQYSGKLEDVSVGGAKLRLEAACPPQGSGLQISHGAAGEIAGTCEWCDGTRIGISFGLSEPALRLISHCLRQGIPRNDHAA